MACRVIEFGPEGCELNGSGGTGRFVTSRSLERGESDTMRVGWAWSADGQVHNVSQGCRRGN